ncbi:hypothetical protein [Modestobacter sp. I12A-02662]|uniref:hypothetical protein n=1 Tax=Modestobacter sp. I12A-02662 TaxID=1730496 RepID=UPI0034E040E9
MLRPDLPGWLLAALRGVTLVAWPVPLVDYVVRLVLAEQRWRFVRENWIDGLAVLLPLLLRDEVRVLAAEVRALRAELGAARGGITPAG